MTSVSADQITLRLPLLALSVVLLQTALRLELRDKPTLRGHRKSVVRDPLRTSAARFCRNAERSTQC
jgi:hypothetical protein